ncbi:MAG: STAS domain-containing protein [Planctomycetota bacterium]|jgi:anti-anti-sigma factor
MPPEDNYGAFARPDPDKVASVRQIGTASFIKVNASALSSVEAPVLQDRLHQVITSAHEGVRDIVLDLGHVTLVNSMAIGVLVTAHTSADHRGMRLILTGLSESVLTLLEATKMTSIFTVCRSDADLEALLKK